MKTGDAISVVAKPLAKTIDYFTGSDLQHCAGCNKMHSNLNAGMNLADAIYDRFWPQRKENHAVHSNEDVRS